MVKSLTLNYSLFLVEYSIFSVVIPGDMQLSRDKFHVILNKTEITVKHNLKPEI